MGTVVYRQLDQSETVSIALVVPNQELRRGKVNDKLPVRNSRDTVLNVIVAAILGNKNMTNNFQAI